MGKAMGKGRDRRKGRNGIGWEIRGGIGAMRIDRKKEEGVERNRSKLRRGRGREEGRKTSGMEGRDREGC